MYNLGTITACLSCSSPLLNIVASICCCSFVLSAPATPDVRNKNTCHKTRGGASRRSAECVISPQNGSIPFVGAVYQQQPFCKGAN
jgi:hypothetical protein